MGVANTTFSYAIYAWLIYVGVAYALANLLALVLGIGFSFFMQGRFVFGNRGARQFGKFVLVWGVIYIVMIFFIGIFKSFGFSSYVAGALVLPISTVLSFIAQKFFVFRTHAELPRSDGG